MTFPTVDTRYIETFKNHTQGSAPLCAKAHSESLLWFDADPGELPVFLARADTQVAHQEQAFDFSSDRLPDVKAERANWHSNLRQKLRLPFASTQAWKFPTQALPTVGIASAVVAIPALIFALTPSDHTQLSREAIEISRFQFASHLLALAVASAFAAEPEPVKITTPHITTSANETVIARNETVVSQPTQQSGSEPSNTMVHADDVAASLPAWGGDTFYSSMTAVARNGSSAKPIKVTVANEPDLIIAAVEAEQADAPEPKETPEFANPTLLQAALADGSSVIEPAKKPRRVRKKKAKVVPIPLPPEAAAQDASKAPFFASVKLPPLFGGEAPKTPEAPEPEPVIVTPQASSTSAWAPTSINDIFVNFQ